MADLPVLPVQNYGQLLGSYGESLADQSNANTNRLTAVAQLPKTAADTSLTNAQAQGVGIANQKAQLGLSALQQYMAAQQASAAQTAQPLPGASASGSGSGASPFTDDDNLTGAASASMDQAVDQKLRVNRGYTPPEYAQAQAALKLAAITGDSGYATTAQQQHDLRVQNQSAQSVKNAQDISDTAYSVATAPKGTAFAALNAIHPDTAAIVAKSVGVDPEKPQSWNAEQKQQLEDRSRNYATEFANKLHQFTGDEYQDKGDGLRNSRTGNLAIGNQAQGISPRQFAELATEGKSLVDVPQSDGSTRQEPKWRAAGFPNLDAWVRNSANGAGANAPLHASSQPSSGFAVTPTTAAPQGAALTTAPKPTAVDPVLKTALSDPDYKLQTPKVVSGQTATPAQLEQSGATVKARTDLLKNTSDATQAASQSLTYLNAAKAVLDSKGAPVTGPLAKVAAAASGLPFGQKIDATNYQVVAKNLQNAAVQGAKANFPGMTQSEVGLQLDELSPSTKMTPDAIRELVGTNIRNAQYALDTGKRAQQYLSAGGDPQKFATWKYWQRDKAINAGPTTDAPASGALVRTATGPNGQKLYLRNGQWSAK